MATQTTKPKRAQLNICIRTTVRSKVVNDAKDFNKYQDGVGEVAIAYFFDSLSKSARSRLYRRLPNRTNGRKLK